MAKDTMSYMQEERETVYSQGTSPEIGGRSVPGYFYAPPQQGENKPLNPAPEESPSSVGNPQTGEEAYLGSFQAALQNNLGYFVVIELK